MNRKTIHFFGNVQGVGFRYTTCSLASRCAVVGYVRNLRNGSVELVVEGNADEGNAGEVGRFLETLRDRMSGHIDREEVSESPATGEFTTFEIL